jgi:hypothetical protein
MQRIISDLKKKGILRIKRLEKRKIFQKIAYAIDYARLASLFSETFDALQTSAVSSPEKSSKRRQINRS